MHLSDSNGEINDYMQKVNFKCNTVWAKIGPLMKLSGCCLYLR